MVLVYGCCEPLPLPKMSCVAPQPARMRSRAAAATAKDAFLWIMVGSPRLMNFTRLARRRDYAGLDARLFAIVVTSKLSKAHPYLMKRFALLALFFVAMRAHAGDEVTPLLKQAPGLRADVLRLAIDAVHRAEERRLVQRRDLLTVIDYSLPSSQPRL